MSERVETSPSMRAPADGARASVEPPMLESPVVSDDALVSRWRGGDIDAGEALIERHYDAVVRFFRTKTGAGVDDLVQRVFLVCAERLATYASVGTFRAFLFGIARNVLFEHLRGKARDRRPDALMGTSAIVDLAPGVQTHAFRREAQRALVDALQRIPLDLQLVLELYYWEELDVGELAVALGVPEGTVKSRLHRARAQLRETMEASRGPRAGEGELPAERWAERMRGERPEPEPR